MDFIIAGIGLLSFASTLIIAAPILDELATPTTTTITWINAVVVDFATPLTPTTTNTATTTTPQPSRRSPHIPDPWSDNEEMSIDFYRYSNRFNASVGTTDTKMFDDFNVMANGECFTFTSPNDGDPLQKPFYSYTWDVTWPDHTEEGGEYTPKNKGDEARGLPAKKGAEVHGWGMQLKTRGKKPSPPPTKWPGCQASAMVTIYQKRLCYGERLEKSLWNHTYMFNVPEGWGGAQSVRVTC